MDGWQPDSGQFSIDQRYVLERVPRRVPRSFRPENYQAPIPISALSGAPQSRCILDTAKTARYGNPLQLGANGMKIFATWLSTALLGAMWCCSQPSAADEQILYRFCSQTNCVDGASPYSSLIADSAGNLFGTTSAGGTYDLGVVFKISSAGTETVLYSFKGGSDGATPYAGLVFDAAGDLLGTTVNGGGSTQCTLGCGTVFKLAPDGSETVLHAFCLEGPVCRDGIGPVGGLTLDAAGNIYGTTEYGSIDTHLDNGMVFRLSPDGKEKIIWSFGGSDTGNPTSGVLLDGKYGILGTASPHGASGAIYRIAPNGLESVLASRPAPFYSELTTDGLGHFFGTTLGYPWIVYEFIPPHDFAALHRFTGGGDGITTRASFAYYRQHLYGVTLLGYEYQTGAIVQLKSSGKRRRKCVMGSKAECRILYYFGGSPDGNDPEATPLILNGNLYGTTLKGGTTGCGGNGCGTVYEYSSLPDIASGGRKK